MSADDRIERARVLYEQAVFGGDPAAPAIAERELDAVEADLALARGRIVHARFLEDRKEDPNELALFQRAAQLYQNLGDIRGEAESLFWVGTFHQVVRQDVDAALPALERAHALATRAGDTLTISYTLRHLSFADQAAGRLDAAQEQMEQSLRLRREIGFLPGVAANLLALAGFAADAGRRDDALGLVDEARAIAEASGAHGVLRWVEEVRDSL